MTHPDPHDAADFCALSDLPPRTELIDGRLHFARPQDAFRSVVPDLLVGALRDRAPEALRVRRQSAVVLGPRWVLVPVVCVVRAEATTGVGQTRFEARDVVLAVEVVSPESESRDRTTKPYKYAAAGIPHLWLVEQAGTAGHPVVHVYELDQVTRAYALTGIHHDRVKLNVPYPLDIDLTAVHRL